MPWPRNLWGNLNANFMQLLDDMRQQYYDRLNNLRRRLKTDKRTAARQVLLAPRSKYDIYTDVGHTFEDVLSFGQWQQVRQAEEEREAMRVSLRKKKEQDRATYLVARGGHPLPDAPADVQRALEPFVTACDAVRAELEQRVRHAASGKGRRTQVAAVETSQQSVPEDRLPPVQDTQ